MSDSLRDRIAAAIKATNDRVAGFIGYDEMADAVMIEVKKELANEYNKGYGDGHEEGWCEGWDANE